MRRQGKSFSSHHSARRSLFDRCVCDCGVLVHESRVLSPYTLVKWGFPWVPVCVFSFHALYDVTGILVRYLDMKHSSCYFQVWQTGWELFSGKYTLWSLIVKSVASMKPIATVKPLVRRAHQTLYDEKNFEWNLHWITYRKSLKGKPWEGCLCREWSDRSLATLFYLSSPEATKQVYW